MKSFKGDTRKMRIERLVPTDPAVGIWSFKGDTRKMRIERAQAKEIEAYRAQVSKVILIK